MARVGLRFSDVDFALFLAEVDANGDGVVEYSEFQAAVLGHHGVKMAATGQRATRALT
jgi:Ca2+-binding EF-hand superfamily protein